MEKYAVVSTDNEKLASMTKVGYCEKCKAPVFGDGCDPQRTCDCIAATVINFGS